MLVEADNDGSEIFLEWVNIGEHNIPVDHLSGILIPYIGRQHSFDYISATDVLNKTIETSQTKKIK